MPKSISQRYVSCRKHIVVQCTDSMQAQQIMHVRVAESASDKNARRKLEEEVESSTKTIKKLKERQDALVAAPSKNDMSASELHMKGERDKLWVSRRPRLSSSRENAYTDCSKSSDALVVSRTSRTRSLPSVSTVHPYFTHQCEICSR